MSNEFKLSYTAADINAKLGKIDNLAEKSELPTKTSDLINDSDYLTEIPEEYVTESKLDAKGLATQEYTDNALTQKSQVQIIKWEEND